VGEACDRLSGQDITDEAPAEPNRSALGSGRPVRVSPGKRQSLIKGAGSRGRRHRRAEAAAGSRVVIADNLRRCQTGVR